MKRILNLNLIVILMTMSGMLASCANLRDKQVQSKPNILIIVADDLGWNDVGFHQSDIKTPHIDALVARGVELTRFYAAPICSPTRAGLLTGKYPDRFGMRDNVIMPRIIGGLPPSERTTAEMLADAGYKHRGAFGKWHLGHSDAKYHPLNQGFTRFYGQYNGAIDYFTHYRNGTLDWHDDDNPSLDSGYSTDLIGSQAIDFITDNSNDEPFFAYVAFNAPHSPMQAQEEELKKYGYDENGNFEKFPTGGAQEGEYNREGYGQRGRGNTLRQTYAAMVTDLDINIGKIWEALEASGKAENTLIWLMSDNGGASRFGGNNEPLRGGKHTEWEGGVRVISAVTWPGKISPGTTSDELIAYIDVLPTLAKIVGDKNSNSSTDGIVVTPALLGKELEDRYIFLGHEALVSKEWKTNKGELFRIEEDREEKNNVASQFPEQLKKMNDTISTIKNEIDRGVILKNRDENWRPKENWNY